MWSYLLLTERALNEADFIVVVTADMKTELQPEMELFGYPLADSGTGVSVWLSLASHDAEFESILNAASNKLGRRFRSAIELSIGRGAFGFSLEVARRLAAEWQAVAYFEEESAATKQACFEASIECCFR